jgi:hypothetical protein
MKSQQFLSILNSILELFVSQLAKTPPETPEAAETGSG